VFTTTVGTTMSGTNLLGRHFKRLLRRVELPAIRLHDLRHTCATILLMVGKHPKYVQELLGPRQHKHHPRHLLSRDRGDGRRAWRGDGRGPLRLYCCRIAAIAVFGHTSQRIIPHT
jgi:integrase